MKLAIAILGVLMMGALLTWGWQNSTQHQLRKAFEAQERADGDCLGKSCYGIDGDYVRAERWKNFQKYAKELMPLAATTHVYVDKTTDGGDWVITLSDSVGENEYDNPVSGHHRVSLWIRGSGENQQLQVRSVSPY